MASSGIKFPEHVFLNLIAKIHNIGMVSIVDVKRTTTGSIIVADHAL